MPANYVLLEKITVGAAGASSVTFSGIPQTGYTDLVIKTSTRASTAEDSFSLRFNSDSGSNYPYRRLIGNGSSASSDSGTASSIVLGRQSESGYTANTFGNCEFYIPNYTSSNYKSVSADSVNENNATTARAQLGAGLWNNTAAITTIEVFTSGSTFVQGSTFYLYGVAKLGTTPAIVPYATGGDTIMTDGTYWYHAFRSSGTFTPAKGLSCDVLVVAGGGGGGAAGGGAGGLFYSASNSIGTAQTVTVGAGGAGAPSNRSTRGVNGSNSQFGSLTAAVGGGGGGQGTVGIETGNSGGSGGGGAPRSGGPYAGGAGTSGQGNTGGTSGSASGFYAGGGGGGAGAAGSTGDSSAGTGAGGAGLNTYSSWATATGTGVSGFYAGGGGGGSDNSAGTGGSGGGGAGSSSTGNSGTANTGGGGGGSSNVGGGAGGSGIVIVRYAV